MTVTHMPGLTQAEIGAICDALDLVKEETIRAAKKFKPFNSSHEGYGIIKEELDEMWDEIKANNLDAAKNEAVQLAAMAVRYITDVPGTKEYKSEKGD